MAEQGDSAQERNEAPTPKRIEDARKKGQIARSKELNTLFILLASILGLMGLSNFMKDQFYRVSKTAFSIERSALFDDNFLYQMTQQAIMSSVYLMSPMLLIVFIAIVLSSLMLGGWIWTAKPMEPQLSRMDPIKGIKKIFSWQGIMELFKSLIKFFLIASVAVTLLWASKDQLLELGSKPLKEAVLGGFKILFLVGAGTICSLILVALVDVPFQLWQHYKQLKMSKQEIKDEMKETEGKPELKAKIKQLQREVATRRMMQELPSADVVITNPTHFAVALRYDKLNSMAPKVVAKGTDLVAQKICEIANEHKIMIYREPPLARAIYFSTELDQEIPSGLYIAVAQILAYVFQLNEFKQGRRDRPNKPAKDIPIPEELQR